MTSHVLIDLEQASAKSVEMADLTRLRNAMTGIMMMETVVVPHAILRMISNVRPLLMSRAFVMESVEMVRSEGRNTVTIHYIVLRIVQDQNLDFIVNFKIMHLVRRNVEMEF